MKTILGFFNGFTEESWRLFAFLIFQDCLQFQVRTNSYYGLLVIMARVRTRRLKQRLTKRK